MKKLLLCRKHIGEDLTETAEFTKATHKCLFCRREYARKWYRRKYGKGEDQEQITLSNNDRKEIVQNPNSVLLADKPKKQVNPRPKMTDDEKRAKCREYNKQGKEELRDWYVKQAIRMNTGLKPNDIPQEYVDTYRELMKLKRGLKQLK